MEVEKLIEAIRLCGSAPKVEQCRKCSYWSDGNMSKCIPKMTEDAATVIQYLDEGAQEVNKALQEQIAENEKLRAELEQADKSGKTKAYILDGFYCVICHKWHRRVKEIEVYLTRDEAEVALRGEQDNG